MCVIHRNFPIRVSGIPPSAGTDSARLVAEIERHANDWDLTSLASALALSPTLVIGATHGIGGANNALADAIRAQCKGKVSNITIDSDHAFSDHRIALSVAVIGWLRRQTAGALPKGTAR